MSVNDTISIKVAYNPLREIMKSSHFNANWKRVSGDARPYRVIFAEQLRLSWSRYRTQQEAKKNWQLRQQLRDESNFNGLPMRSTPLDYHRTYYTRSSRMASIGQ